MGSIHDQKVHALRCVIDYLKALTSQDWQRTDSEDLHFLRTETRHWIAMAKQKRDEFINAVENAEVLLQESEKENESEK